MLDSLKCFVMNKNGYFKPQHRFYNQSMFLLCRKKMSMLSNSISGLYDIL